MPAVSANFRLSVTVAACCPGETGMNEGIQSLLDRLWADYTALDPRAQRIHQLLTDRGERVVHDHVALRTLRHGKLGIEPCARLFEQHGYRARAEYEFPQEKVHARHYESDEPGLPKILISELELDSFSRGLRDIVNSLMRQVDPDALPGDAFVLGGCLWHPVLHDTWERLRAESTYAAWMAAFGFRAHHFTVLVNELDSFDSLAELNAFLGQSGFPLDDAGGEIRSSPETLLEQSATLPAPCEIEFADARMEVPGPQYEFIYRHPLPDGELFSGFKPRPAGRLAEGVDDRIGT